MLPRATARRLLAVWLVLVVIPYSVGDRLGRGGVLLGPGQPGDRVAAEDQGLGGDKCEDRIFAWAARLFDWVCHLRCLPA
jgi:hypothetical protein